MQNVRCESMCESGGLVICKLRTGDLVICELIVRTTDANLGYNGNQKVRTFYAIKRGPYTCLGIRNIEMTFITIQNAERNRPSVHFTKIPQNYTCPLRRQLSALYWAYVYAMPNQRINTTQTRSPASAGIANRPLVFLGRHLILYSKSRFMNNS